MFVATQEKGLKKTKRNNSKRNASVRTKKSVWSWKKEYVGGEIT